jgi:hypothetical protein
MPGKKKVKKKPFPLSLLLKNVHYPMIIGKRKKTGRKKNAIQKIRKNGLGN